MSFKALGTGFECGNGQQALTRDRCGTIFEPDELGIEHLRIDQLKGHPLITGIDGLLSGLSQYQRKDHEAKAINESQPCQTLHQSNAANRSQRVSLLLFQRCDCISNGTPYQTRVVPSERKRPVMTV
jgi:hypothetical protein